MKKIKITLWLKNADDIRVRLVKYADNYPKGLNLTLSLFKDETHPNIDDLLSDGFEVYLVIYRRVEK